ncbi:ABC transporter substrate-binding protein [Sulfitobacter sp. F26204]|uniref:ABC transporter substrate-binding protein n=1 Tax=Sulfitobacter sp. F26204 TaxID=2996014 RepID=UPI00225DE506|nr:ABC transporter substrate-binding protein [Sulfitobacter sp. F26204]MCX7560673.1 ABC transporter substrate-binding protein [Sulfitobacter sp. F26204]
MKKTLLLAALLGATAFSAQAGNLRIGLESDPDALDPDKSRTFVGRIVFTSLCDKLFDITPELEIVPQLATASTTSDDGKTMTLTLREGVTFHDGTPFDAEAVKANIERSKTFDESVRKSELTSIETIDVVDDLTVRFNLSAPDAPLIAQLADRSGMMMAPSALSPEFSNAPVCSGPFKYVERVAQDKIVLEKYEDYWNADAIDLDGVTYTIIPDSTVRLANLQSGDIDIVNQLAATDAEAVRNAKGISFANITGLGYQGLTFNLANGEMAQTPLGQDAKVRKAFDLALDRAAISQVVFDGLFQPASQPFSPSSPYYNPDFPPVERDIEAAKALLAEAGVAVPLKVKIQVPNTPVTMQLVQVIQSMVAEAGFEVEIIAKEFATLLNDADVGDFQISQQGWSGRIDPDGNIHQFVTTGAGFNDGQYSNAEIDSLLNEARTVSDPAKRVELYQKAAAIYSEDRPLLYLYHLAWLYGIDDKVQGLTLYPDGMLRLEGVSVAD